MNNTVETIKFKEGEWTNNINVRNFVSLNVTPYEGDASFLSGPTERTTRLWEIASKALKEERDNNGCRAIDTERVSTITSHPAGYISKEDEVIVGLQTDELLKRAMKPYGGVRVVEGAVKERGLEVSPEVKNIFYNYVTDHNNGVFSAYDAQIRAYRSKGILTGLPDNYARGRIIGDYRRLALYGADYLIKQKVADHGNVGEDITDANIRLREEISKQVLALKDIIELGKIYDLDLSRPAENAREAVQWTYMAYLAAVKEQDGAAMSLGNVSSFLDIYIEKDLNSGLISESDAQEMIDQFVMKLRFVRHLRPGAYDEIFGGDPTWVTESIGGQFSDGRTKVTKTSFRFLQTLYNLGPAPEPNLTVLWSQDLPEGFKNFCSQVSVDTSSVQYENDDLMRPNRGSDDYGIACCVSYQEIGKRIQHFGARTNLAKTLLLAINGGKDELSGVKLIDGIEDMNDEVLDYEKVKESFQKAMQEVARVYAKTMYIIHYMHDKYYYEKAQMAFIDSNYGIDVAYGAAGISIVADSLSAIKHAKVTPVRNQEGLTVDFKIEGDYPKYGNDDDKVDNIAIEVTREFFNELKKHKTYKDATPTLSLLTITSNVVYGKKTGATPDGRAAGVPFAPGANPMHGRDECGAIASLNSVAKLDYNDAQDGISNTFSIVPKSLGSEKETQVENLVHMMDGYFEKGAHHLNVNVLNRETLIDAYEHPENYPQLTIRVSGYAVNFTRLSRAHQLEVISRTFHENM
ncbi:formate C-acetyltransferase [Aureibacter tunicatorum]|uniref:Formate acetyltransferase n=1 Tax=Aureibacter tunicatorum TaxID=866807 RepID=A0AAE4BR39_9BACT|nr:formate C-acetyltransferase [Aureibacter tunicatorum]MDR6239829.1 formate C-acetyltransferase [Aureibacter tunicatorum]BDD04304.1 formate acetyltransferase [Aureibacter tunicatorum]